MSASGRRNFRQWPFRVWNRLAKAIFSALIATLPVAVLASSGQANRCANVYQNIPADHSDPSGMIQQFASRYGIDLEKKEYSVSERKFELPGLLPSETYELGRSYYLQKDHVQFLSPQATNDIASMPALRTAPVLGDSVIHHPELQGEIWQLPGGESFHWMNVGSSLLLEDGGSELFPQAATVLAKQHPGQAFKIDVPYNPNWLKARDALLKRQMVTSIKITNRYEENKPYLDPEQLFDLRRYDTEEPNASDYFVLLDDTTRSPLTLTPEEFKAHTVASLRLARLEHRSFMDRSILMGPDSLSNHLPHASRVQGKLAKHLQELLWRLTREKNLRVTEITRVNRFGAVPKPAMKALFRKALGSAKNPKKPTDIFVLECDSSSLPSSNGGQNRTLVDYYREEYGFEILVQLNDPASPGPGEYLMYLDTRSDRYNQVMTKLDAETTELKSHSAPRTPPVENWSGGWNLQADYLTHSPYAKLRKWITDINGKISEFKKQSLPDLAAGAKNDTEDLSSGELKTVLEKLNVRLLESVLIKIKSDQASAEALKQLRKILALREVGFSYSMTAKILVLGETASLYGQFLKESENRRQVDTQWPHDGQGTYDHVILSSVLAKHNSADRNAILQQASRLLKPGGELIIMDNVIGALGNKDVSLPSEALAQAKASILTLAETFTPLTRSQALAAIAIKYDRFRQLKPLQLQPLLDELQAAGFTTSSWSGGGSSLHFRKSH